MRRPHTTCSEYDNCSDYSVEGCVLLSRGGGSKSGRGGLESSDTYQTPIATRQTSATRTTIFPAADLQWHIPRASATNQPAKPAKTSSSAIVPGRRNVIPIATATAPVTKNTTAKTMALDWFMVFRSSPSRKTRKIQAVAPTGLCALFLTEKVK